MVLDLSRDLAALGRSTFDVVLASNVLEHFEPDAASRLVGGIAEVLRPGGRVVLVQPNFRFAFRRYFDDYTHRAIFTDVSLAALLRAHRLSIELVQPRFLPVFAARRARVRAPVAGARLPARAAEAARGPDAGRGPEVLRHEADVRTANVSVVFPAYNEAPNIGAAIADFLATGVVDEIIVVDNNSIDGTGDAARQAGARVVQEAAQGYGHALRRGLREASGDLVILAEPDGTFVGRDVLKLLAYADDFDMVCGTRTTRELVWEEANMGWFLRIGNVVVAKMIQVLYGGPSLTDCGCTLRLTHRAALVQMLDELTVGARTSCPRW